MDLDSEIPLMYSIDSHGGIQLEPPLNFASIEFNRQSGKRMRTNRGILPFDIQDYAASNALPSALPAANPATTKFPYIKSKASGSVTGPYEDSIIEHVSLNPRREAWTLPADSMPYRDPAHKGPASGACQPYNHLKPLMISTMDRDFTSRIVAPNNETTQPIARGERENVKSQKISQ